MKHQLSISYKKLISQVLFLALVLAISATPLHIYSQEIPEETGLPGDHFSLEGALELFKKSKSPEDFEMKLNSEDSKVNNLDLNEDGEIDYVRVVDNMDGNVHAIVISVPISETESQDIAVIEIEKTGENTAILQILGDEDVYGEQVIIEPYAEENQGGNKGGPEAEFSSVVVAVNVFGWSSIRYIYRPSYVVWVSPWKYRYYPKWWSPWRPLSWHTWHPFRIKYRPHYRAVSTHRVLKAHRVYVPKRKTTNRVATRTKVVKSKTVVNKSGKKATVSKSTTSVKGKNAAGAKVGASKSTTSVAGKSANGTKVKGTKTTKKAGAKSQNGSVGKKKTTTKSKVKGKNGKSAGVKKTKTKTKKKKNG